MPVPPRPDIIATMPETTRRDVLTWSKILIIVLILVIGAAVVLGALGLALIAQDQSDGINGGWDGLGIFLGITALVFAFAILIPGLLLLRSLRAGRRSAELGDVTRLRRAGLATAIVTGAGLLLPLLTYSWSGWLSSVFVAPFALPFLVALLLIRAIDQG